MIRSSFPREVTKLLILFISLVLKCVPAKADSNNLLGVKGCGFPQISGRIRDGVGAQVHQFPWVVSVQKEGRHDCTGTLITSRHVLTAAHCLEDLKMMTVSFGSNNLRRAASVRIDRALLSPKRIPAEMSPNGMPYLDLMVLVLQERLPLGLLVRPICISQNAPAKPNTRVVIAGYGFTDDGPVVSHDLHFALTRIISPDDHKCRMASYWGPETEICVYYGRTSICAGDSGGPLMTVKRGAYYLVGVAAYAAPKARGDRFVCAGRDDSQIFTRVSAFEDFILTAVARSMP